MVYWLALKLVPRDVWLVLIALAALQLSGTVDVIGPAVDLLSSWLPEPSLDWVW
ncbi:MULTISPECIES: hypothetical protein [unclassified Haloarcula]|uniref:hypothetical protein n=1 Tax=unclassified Haloarcula TaxID=2624677 RepID=UPI00177C3A63|nr:MULTISPECIES: hypothetical protein [unclassified Haloarcula]